MAKDIDLQDLKDGDEVVLYYFGSHISDNLDPALILRGLMEKAGIKFISKDELVIDESAKARSGGFGTVKFGTLKSGSESTPIAIKKPNESSSLRSIVREPHRIDSLIREVTIQSEQSYYATNVPCYGISLTKTDEGELIPGFVFEKMKNGSVNDHLGEAKKNLADLMQKMNVDGHHYIMHVRVGHLIVSNTLLNMVQM